MSIEHYQRLVGSDGSIIDTLGEPPGVEDADLERPRPRDLVLPANLR
jgi:hypothetical protein